ncbi:hypothetical protein [Cetobacterium sp.]|uniref:hypothetical protein n=1 Tax=Cetobacterium sp. TaxID=2071632 RepID=UPI003F3C4D81
MKNIVEGFKNEIDLKIFENRLAEINPTCFLIWKVGVNLALRVSDVLKITVDQAENYLLTGTYMAVDKKTGKVNHVKINENTSIALKEALELRKKAIVSGVPSGKRGITTLRIFLTIDAPFIFNVFRPFFIQKFSQVI